MANPNNLSLQTQRLFLRTLTEEDAPLVTALYGNEYETEQAALEHIRWIQNNAYENRLIYYFHIWIAETNECIGRIYLHSKPELNHEVEIGYGICEPHRNNGYATEAAQALLNFGFEKAGQDVIVAIVKPENIASRCVIEKLGFANHGVRMVLDENNVTCEFDYFQLRHTDWNSISRQTLL